MNNRVPVRYVTCVSVARPCPEFLEGLLASAHASAPAPHRGPGDRDPRDRVLEPTRRDPGRAGSRVGCSKDLHPGADQRTSRPRLPHRGGAPVPPGSRAVHPCLAREQARRAVTRSRDRRRAGQGPRMRRPRRGTRRGRHDLHRLRGSRVTQPDVRRAYPRAPSPLHERRRKDPARQRPRRRDAPPPG